MEERKGKERKEGRKKEKDEAPQPAFHTGPTSTPRGKEQGEARSERERKKTEKKAQNRHEIDTAKPRMY